MQSRTKAVVLFIAAALMAPAGIAAANESVPRVDISEHAQNDKSRKPSDDEDTKERPEKPARKDHDKAEKSAADMHAHRGQETASEHRNPHGEAGYRAAMERREAARARHEAAGDRRDAAKDRREAAKERREAAKERRSVAAEHRDAAADKREAAREKGEAARAAHGPAR